MKRGTGKAVVGLMAPVLLLLGAGAWSQLMRPTPLRVASTSFKRLPSSRVGTVAVQALVFLSPPPGPEPAWWGEPVDARLGDGPQYINRSGRLSVANWEIHACSFDTTKRQYRVPIYYMVFASPRWAPPAKFKAELLLDQGRTVGQSSVETPIQLR